MINILIKNIIYNKKEKILRESIEETIKNSIETLKGNYKQIALEFVTQVLNADIPGMNMGEYASNILEYISFLGEMYGDFGKIRDFLSNHFNNDQAVNKFLSVIRDDEILFDDLMLYLFENDKQSFIKTLSLLKKGNKQKTVSRADKKVFFNFFSEMISDAIGWKVRISERPILNEELFAGIKKLLKGPTKFFRNIGSSPKQKLERIFDGLKIKEQEEGSQYGIFKNLSDYFKAVFDDKIKIKRKARI